MEQTLKRPKGIDQEDEDELLNFQEQFLKNRPEMPAAKVIKINNNNNSNSQNQNKTDSKPRIEIDCNI